jgi:AcrR family transcriptional regulator
MARRSDHSREEIRGMALAAAETIVANAGLPALTARRIAQAIGYTVGTLYLVFENLDDLILQVNGRTLDDLHAALSQAAEAAPAGPARVEALARGYLEYARAQHRRWNALFLHQLPAGQPFPDWYGAKIAAMFTLVEAVLSSLSTKRDARDLTIAARALWSGVHGICILDSTRRLGPVAAQDLVDSLVRNYLRGLEAG